MKKGLKITKKIVALLLVFVLSYNYIVNIYANEILNGSIEEEAAEGIFKALHNIESCKMELGLGNIDLEMVTIGERIHSYIYINKSFEEHYSFYPLIYNHSLIALAILVDEDENIYQITTSLVDEINSAVEKDESFALLYDSDSCYMYGEEKGLRLLDNFEMEIPERDSLKNKKNISDFSKIELSNMDLETGKGFSSIFRAKTQTYYGTQAYYKCDVKYVSQSKFNICWAASIACIVNYLKGTNLTALEVAQSNGINLNNGLSAEGQEAILRKYGVAYTYANRFPSNSVILRNIKAGYPIKAGFQSNGNYHAVVVYGVNLPAGYISLMDPQIGYETAVQYSNGYKYVSGYSGAEFTSNNAICQYWTSSYK